MSADERNELTSLNASNLDAGQLDEAALEEVSGGDCTTFTGSCTNFSGSCGTFKSADVSPSLSPGVGTET